MSDVVIRGENLGKKYRLGQKEHSGYKTLREALADSARRLARGNRLPPEKDFWALRELSFEIAQGEVIGIIGRNGAGKSTLLKILSRITEPTTGRVRITGRVASLLEVGTGFHPELTGRENIFLNGAILGMSRAEIKARFDEIVAFSEIEPFLDTPVKRYSSGMYVRLAFAVAAHLDPEILIVDEVLAVGDIQFQEKCLGKMREVAAGSGRTIFFVSHNLSAIQQLCTRVILLRDGHLVSTGRPDQVINDYVSSAATSGYIAGRQADQNIELTNVRVIAGNEVNPIITNRDPVTIEFSVSQLAEIAGANLGFEFKDMKNRVIFRSEIDLPALATYPQNTLHTATIPANLLTPGQYKLTVFLHIPCVRHLYYAEDAFSLSIVDAGTRFSLYEGKADYGCVFVECQWHSEVHSFELV